MEKPTRFVSIKEVGDGYVLGLLLEEESGTRTVKEAVIPEGADDAAIGAKVRELFRTRIRNRSKKGGAE